MDVMKTMVGCIAAVAFALAVTLSGCATDGSNSGPDSPNNEQTSPPSAAPETSSAASEAPSAGDEASGNCDKDLLAGSWQRLDGADPPLSTATTWTFVPEFPGANNGTIECDGDCDRALGPPLSYELNQPTMQSRMKIQFEDEETIYYCKVTPDELVLGPFRFGPAEAKPDVDNTTFDGTYVAGDLPSTATVVVRNGRIVSFAEEAAGAGKCELAIESDFAIDPSNGTFSGNYTGTVSSGPYWCVPTDGTMSGQVEGQQMAMTYTNATSGASFSLQFART